jgi:hypothetical protein
LSSSLNQFVTVFGMVECWVGLTLNVTLVCVSGPSSSSFTPSDSLPFLGSSVDRSEKREDRRQKSELVLVYFCHINYIKDRNELA